MHTETVYPVSYQNEISIFDMNMRPGPSVWARPDCNCTKHCCGTACSCLNATANGNPKYCTCGSPGCNKAPVDALPPCPRGVNPGRTHRFYQDKAVVPFGFGLSCEPFTNDHPPMFLLFLGFC